MVDAVRVVREAYDAHARGDMAAVFALLHPEVAIRQTLLLPWGGVRHGHEGARQFFQILAENTDALPEPEDFIAAGDQVAVVGRLRGRARSTGREIDLRIVHIWTVVDGLITSFEAIIDTPAMLEALGANEQDIL